MVTNGCAVHNSSIFNYGAFTYAGKIVNARVAYFYAILNLAVSPNQHRAFNFYFSLFNFFNDFSAAFFGIVALTLHPNGLVWADTVTKVSEHFKAPVQDAFHGF